MLGARVEDSGVLIESVAFTPVRMIHPTRVRRTVTADGFARLLERLHPDPEEAAHEYERLRRTLVKFFDWRGAPAADECADEALDRLVRKLDETTVDDIKKYAHGIARLVLLERQRRPAFSSLDELPESLVAAAPVNDDGNRLQDCFERCLAELPEESRMLVVGYYEGERNAKISNRRRLASVLGITENALRSRVQRLRDRLEQCVHACAAHTVSDTL